MAIPQEKVTNLPVQLTPAQVQMMLAGVDCTGLSEQDKLELAAVLWEDYQKSAEITNYKPQRIKIVKETQMFADSLGNSFDELRGVIIARQTTRGYWPKKGNDKRPLCSSLDGKTGRMRHEAADGSVFFEERHCKDCEFNKWGSAVDEHGQPLAGKACKEMRRIYIQQPGAMFPSYISLSPTSINAWDDFISGRLNAGISDLKAQVVLTLIESGNNKFSYSIVKAKNGPALKPLEILEFMKIKKQFEEKLLGMDVEDEDYYSEEPGEGTVGDAWEPPEPETVYNNVASSDLPEDPPF